MDRYNGYRGRSGARGVLRFVIGMVLILVLLTGILLMFGQRYLYYTKDGVRLDLPFLKQEEQPGPDISQVVVEVVRPEPEEPQPDASQPGEQSPEPELPVQGQD